MSKRVTVLMAMQAEAQPVIDHYQLQPVELHHLAHLPARAYQGAIASKRHRVELTVVHCGICPRYGVDAIATQPATLAAHMALERFAPDLLVSAGTCGGFSSRGAAIGDVYLAHERVLFHDRRIALPGFEAYGAGYYLPFDFSACADRLGLKLGILSTGNSLDMPDLDREHMESHGVVVKDMEGAAVAWVAEAHQVPFTALKSVTDLVDTGRPTADEFLEHLQMASSRLQKKLVEFLADPAVVESLQR